MPQLIPSTIFKITNLAYWKYCTVRYLPLYSTNSYVLRSLR